MTLDQAPTGSSVRLRWVDPPADDRARLFVPARPPSSGPVVLTPERMQAAYETIAGWPCYVATPLVRLDDLASRLNLGAIWLKDETKRFGVDSFKAPGAGYAPRQDLDRHVERRPTVGCSSIGSCCRVRAPAPASLTGGCGHRRKSWPRARLGKPPVRLPLQHLRAAAGQQQVRAAITNLGAEVVEVAGTYDDAVRVAAEGAGRNGWIEVSDTAHGGDEEVPLLVMEGYTTLVREIAAARAGPPPFHARLPAGRRRRLGGCGSRCRRRQFRPSALRPSSSSPTGRGAFSRACARRR